ncbi:hypothetical protein [Luteimonas sp. RC10]|uniref:hypothetical protein n=1 Tax=Luteimonas sp. RC10 TaxID=2587035 RepID=UPI0017F9DB0B|nr:hypothetical protein [Luteimonas sp. RC10]MBB3344638.1 hypothetical protein [Luteimonas sp. RC10]
MTQDVGSVGCDGMAADMARGATPVEAELAWASSRRRQRAVNPSVNRIGCVVEGVALLLKNAPEIADSTADCVFPDEDVCAETGNEASARTPQEMASARREREMRVLRERGTVLRRVMLLP